MAFRILSNDEDSRAAGSLATPGECRISVTSFPELSESLRKARTRRSHSVVVEHFSARAQISPFGPLWTIR